ncbi:oxidoreductase-like protein [Glomus cerebriforme]|uniref:Oxidoreductase-like protein n=1 Tax=Glomus cerebriforme TaxID=658196 RepID=A0A397THU2_9GLOM|nr:oxidoreductase-like protein [Glomus cerebriforme]
MFGTLKQLISKNLIGFRQYQHIQFRNYKQNKKNKFDGYWDLILEQPKSESHEQTGDIASLAIGSSISNAQEVYEPIYTIDGEIIPRKPEFPDNCCMSGCAHCVLDIYQEELDEWKIKTNNIKNRLLKEGKPLPNILIKSSELHSNDDIDPGMKAFLELEKSLAEKPKIKNN